MNGFQRFALLLLCCLAVLICFPEYPTGTAWGFIGMMIAMWTGIIMIISVVLGILGLDRFESINRITSFVLIGGILFSLLGFLPQDDKISPLSKVAQGKFPSAQTVKRGIQHLTFNFDFVHRNVHNKNNFINQQNPKEAAKASSKPKAQPQQYKEDDWKNLDIHVEEE